MARVFWSRNWNRQDNVHKVINSQCLLPPFYSSLRSSSPTTSSSSSFMAHCQGHICQCLGRIRLLRRDSVLCIDADRRTSGREFADCVASLAYGLSELGVRKGDVVAIAALNSAWYMEWFLAVTYIGGIVAPLNYRWSFEEAKSAMELVCPIMFVIDEYCSSWALRLRIDEHVPSVKSYAFIGDSPLPNLSKSKHFLSMDMIRRHSQNITTLDVDWAPEGIALICFTSGTTGRPKGVAISHTSLIVQSLAKIAIVGYGEDDVYLHTAPMCHIGAISSCLAVLMAGSRHIFLPKFDAKASLTAIKQHRVTSLITVPAMMADLASFTRNDHEYLTNGESVRKILNGGGGLSSELVNLGASIFPRAKIISAYGMTEACSSLTFITLWDPTAKKLRREEDHKNSGVLVGKPAPHIELRISGESQNSDIPLVGSVLTRGPHLMVRYCGRNTQILSDTVGSGWLDTGDIGCIDDKGNLWLVGRKKDRIKTGGENVYPEEVEAVLRTHPGVGNAVVVGVPDTRLNEMIVACVVARKGWNWTGQDLCHSQEGKELSSKILSTYCHERNLTRYKIPKSFIPWRKPFPLTATGKLRREDLRKEAMCYLQLPSSKL